MLYHREPRLPIDTELMSIEDCSGDEIDVNIEAAMQIQKYLQVEAMVNIKASQKRQKEIYDKNHASATQVIEMNIMSTLCTKIICLHL